MTPTRRAVLEGAASLAALSAFPFAAASAAVRDYQAHDAVGLADMVRRGEASPAELLDAAVAAAEATNPKLNFLSQALYDRARETVAGGLPSGPFTGVPFLLKDLAHLMAGTPTRQGSLFFDGYTAPIDDTLVARFKAAGLSIFGKTTTPEFGLTTTTEAATTGVTRNPWNLERTTGGSSGGAAAAVAAGVVPIAHASDGGGSIRIPASCCGLFGLKPTRGRTPTGPVHGAGWAGLSIHHAVSRSVRDSAVLLDALRALEPGARLAAPPPPQSYAEAARTEPRALTIALITETANGTPVDAECVAAAQAAAALCQDLGHRVEAAAPELDVAALTQAMLAVISVETSLVLDQRAEMLGRPVTEADVEPVTWAYYQRGKTLDPRAYAQATYVFDQTAYRIGAFMQRYDAILTPTLAQPPLPFGVLSLDRPLEAYVEAVTAFNPFCGLYNMTGQPAMSVPLHWSEAGLPIGVMFAGRFGEEHVLFRLAGQLERARPWFDRRPPLTA